ncbi:MAG: DNA-binding protein [Nanoarchaeota archaeon]
MPTLDEIRRKKIEELMQSQQGKLQQQVQEQAQVQQQIEQMESIVKQFLTKDALARYGSLKTAHHDKALQLLMILFQAIQKGQIQSEIDDQVLKKILGQLIPKKKEIKIKRV